MEVTQQFETLKSASVTGSNGAYDYHAQLNEIQESFEEALFVFKENIQVIICFTASPISWNNLDLKVFHQTYIVPEILQSSLWLIGLC